MNRQFDRQRLWRSAGIGLVAFLLWLGRSYYRDHCLFEWHGIASALLVPSIFGSLVFFFAWFGIRGRLTLAGLLLLGWITMPQYCMGGGSNMAAQSSAVANLRTIALMAESQKTQEGYPHSIPLEPFQPYSKHYRLVYKRLKSQHGGSFESFLVSADPIREDCGLRHFLLTKGGTIHATSEQRPATTADPEL